MSSVKLSIRALAHGGDSVGTLPDGRTAFVPFACPGDEVAVTITEDHGRWVRATIADVLEPSADRVQPPCPYFGQCGGCQWQHIAPEAQLAAKAQTVRETLARIGHLTDPAVAAPLASASPYGYRNKIELTVAEDQRGPILGFTRAHSNEVLPIERCLLLPGKSSGLPKAVRGALRFLASRGAAGVKRVTLRVASNGEVAVNLWTAGGPFPRTAAARVIGEATGARTVTRTIVRGDLEKRDISQVEVLSGSGTWRERLGGDRYTVSAPSFFQVNTLTAADLRAEALGLLQADGTMRVADLYAGAGTFTLPMARDAGEVVAVEASRYALADLRANLEGAGLDADVVPGDAAFALGDLGHLDAALIDPPRAGLSDKMVRALERALIPRLVYVSCDPATLARDVARLARSGYVAGRFVPVDLFPQTYHVETVALLTRERQ